MKAERKYWSNFRFGESPGIHFGNAHVRNVAIVPPSSVHGVWQFLAQSAQSMIRCIRQQPSVNSIGQCCTARGNSRDKAVTRLKPANGRFGVDFQGEKVGHQLGKLNTYPSHLRYPAVVQVFT